MLRTLFVSVILLFFARQSIRGAFEALLFYLWIAYFRPESWMWDPTLVRSLHLSFAVGAYLLVRSLPKLGTAPFDIRGLLLGLFLAITTMSALTSEFPSDARNGWIDFGQTLVIGYVLYVLASESFEKFRMAALVIAISLGFEGAKQGYYGLLFSPGSPNNNSLPQLGDNNGVAVGMLMLATLFLALARTSPGKWQNRLQWFFLVGTLYRAITTYSRGAFLGLIAMTMVYIARSNQRFQATIGAVLIASVLLPAMPQRFWDRMNTMKVSSEDQMDNSSASRLHFWRVAMNMAADHPLLGIGYNSFGNAYDAYDFSVGYYGKRRSVHSMWFGVLAELGYPALIIYILLFVFAFFGMSKVTALARAGDVPIQFYHFAVALQAALVACVVGGTFLAWQYTDMLWHFIALTMALRHLAVKTAAAKIVVPEPARVIMRRTA
jgi:putative inorganic carbon (hco3(-)) transporter